MDINTTIPDEQGAAIAQILHVKQYADGNDLITQAAANALLDANKRALIAALSAQTDQAAVDAAMTAYNSVAATPVLQPPIKIKPTL